MVRTEDDFKPVLELVAWSVILYVAVFAVSDFLMTKDMTLAADPVSAAAILMLVSSFVLLLVALIWTSLYPSLP